MRRVEQRADQHYDRTEAEHAAIVAWRRSVLVRAGVEAGLANRLGADRRLDLHDLLSLMERGCPPGLAARILAPL